MWNETYLLQTLYTIEEKEITTLSITNLEKKSYMDLMLSIHDFRIK